MLKKFPLGQLSLKIIFSVLLVSAFKVRAQETPPAWTVGTTYAVNARVSYNSSIYKCLQAHTAIVSWEPPNAPALWQPESGGTNTSLSGAIFSDTFETNQNWTINANGTDTATAGIWERGVPASSRYKGAKQMDAAHGGTNVLVTGRIAYNDVSGGVTSVRSPAITLPNVPPALTNLTLSFWYSFAHDSRSNPADYFLVKIIGNTTAAVFQVSGKSLNRNARWQKQMVNISAFAGQTIRVQFEAADGATDSIVEAAVDDVEISETAIAGQPFPSRFFAPYVDALLYPPYPISLTAANVGVKYYTLAFITNGASSCQAAWGGVVALGENYMLAEINSLRARGGNVIMSFGGANGTELGNSCQTVDALAAQYRAVIEKYNLTHVDFDIEGGAVLDTNANDRRNKAIALLQREATAQNRELVVSYTLPVLPSGLEQSGVNLLRNAVTNGVNVSTVNIMAMDYGAIANPNTMGQNAIDAANSTIAQIQAVFVGKTITEIKRMIGVTPMIGLNDVVPEVFTFADAQMLLSYAQTNNIGRIAMWSMTRDKQCAGAPQVSSDCSGITQSQYAFSNVFKQFTQ